MKIILDKKKLNENKFYDFSCAGDSNRSNLFYDLICLSWPGAGFVICISLLLIIK